MNAAKFHLSKPRYNEDDKNEKNILVSSEMISAFTTVA